MERNGRKGSWVLVAALAGLLLLASAPTADARLRLPPAAGPVGKVASGGLATYNVVKDVRSGDNWGAFCAAGAYAVSRPVGAACGALASETVVGAVPAALACSYAAAKAWDYGCNKLRPR